MTGPPESVHRDAIDDEPTIDLLRRFREGDVKALDRLFARNLVPLIRWVSGRLPAGARDLWDTEDIVQETIVQALPHLADFEYRGEGAVQAYLRRATMNRIKNEYRRVSRRPKMMEADDRLRDQKPSPLEEAIGRETVEDYEEAIAAVSEADRQLVILRLEMNYGYRDIAEATGKPSADAARMATGRAILRLAETMRHRDRS